MSNMTITEEHFPTPQLRLTSNDPALVQRERQFARTQAVIVREAQDELTQFNRTGRYERVARLMFVYKMLRAWRHGVAAATQVPGQFSPARAFLDLENEGFNVPLRLGEVGALREGARWDATERTFVGGEPTPASRLAAELGRQIRQRFEDEEPNASILKEQFESLLYPNERTRSVRLVRGEVARETLTFYAQDEIDAGRSSDGIDLGGDPLCVVPHAQRIARDHLLEDAIELLSLDGCVWSDWANAVYLMAHAWQDRCGYEDVHRMFAVATGAAMFGEVPTLPSDCVARALVMPRAAFVDQVLASSR